MSASSSSPIFILSTGRSGSTTIAHAFSLIDGYTCIHEPDPVLVREASAYRYGDMDASEIASMLRETRQMSVDGMVYCESNQTLSLIVPVLEDVFPEAMYVWLIRNGLDVVASAMQKRWYLPESERGVPYDKCSPQVQSWIDGRIRGDRCGEVSSETWATMSPFEQCCWYWNYVNRLIEHDLSSCAPNRMTRLRLEDINTDLSRVLNDFGLRHVVAPAPARHNAARSNPYDWREWDEEEQAIFDRWCGDLMDQIYPSWREPDGTWTGVEYDSDDSLTTTLRRRYRLVRWANALLAPNSVHA